MKRTIALDLDSVLADIMSPLIDFHNQRFGTNNSLSDHTSYSLSLLWKCTKQEEYERVYAYYFSDEFHHMSPIVGAKEGVVYLAAKYRLAVVTSRPTVIEERTDRWIKKHFGNCISEIVHTNQFSKDPVKKILKSTVCKKIGAQTIIEDALHFARECATNGIKVYLIDQPWNREQKDDENITRFYSWGEIRNFL